MVNSIEYSKNVHKLSKNEKKFIMNYKNISIKIKISIY